MPDPEHKTTRPDTAEISVSGPVNGLGKPDLSGPYFRVRVATRDSEAFHHISIGSAEVLAAELAGLLDRGAP